MIRTPTPYCKPTHTQKKTIKINTFLPYALETPPSASSVCCNFDDFERNSWDALCTNIKQTRSIQ